MNKKCKIFENKITEEKEDDNKIGAESINHGKFIDCRNFITDCLNNRNFNSFSKHRLKDVLRYLEKILSYFANKPLEMAISEKFRIISVQNKNIIDDIKYRIIFLTQLKIFFFSIENKLSIHQSIYPSFNKEENRIIEQLKTKTDFLLSQVKVSDSKRTVSEVFEKFFRNEEKFVEWKNSNCPSFNFETKKNSKLEYDDLLKKRFLIRRGARV